AVQRDWWVEVQADGPDWPHVLQMLEGARLMVDHFGRPMDVPCPGFEAILERDPDITCVKLSAPYRQQGFNLQLAARRLIGHFGAERCLWGSDWPWTQHEGSHEYADCLSWLEDWTNEDDRAGMHQAAEALGFGQEQDQDQDPT
ncbi:MAG: amidohydrolase family protein, partial [Pseudomonadota bacterium]